MAFQLKVLKHLRTLGNFHMNIKKKKHKALITILLFLYYFHFILSFKMTPQIFSHLLPNTLNLFSEGVRKRTEFMCSCESRREVEDRIKKLHTVTYRS